GVTCTRLSALISTSTSTYRSSTCSMAAVVSAASIARRSSVASGAPMESSASISRRTCAARGCSSTGVSVGFVLPAEREMTPRHTQTAIDTPATERARSDMRRLCPRTLTDTLRNAWDYAPIRLGVRDLACGDLVLEAVGIEAIEAALGGLCLRIHEE